MLTQKILYNCASVANRRFISQSLKNFESKATDSATKTSTSTSSAAPPGRSMYIPTNFDKWLLVWVKRYPKGQVPNKITEEVIYHAKGKARVKAANWMMFFTVIMCITTVIHAKNLLKEGDSIQERQGDWRQQAIEEGKKQRGEVK